MNDKEIRDYLKVYEREVEKKYDDVDLEKIQLPSGFKERTMDKIISGRNDEKTTEYKEHKSLRLFTKAARFFSLPQKWRLIYLDLMLGKR